MHAHSQALTLPARSLIPACVCVPGRKSTRVKHTHRCFFTQGCLAAHSRAHCRHTHSDTQPTVSLVCPSHTLALVPLCPSHSLLSTHFHTRIFTPACCSALPPSRTACVCAQCVVVTALLPLWYTVTHTHGPTAAYSAFAVTHLYTPVCTPLCVYMSQLPCHLFLGCVSSFSPLLAAHTSTVLLACSVPHISPVCVHIAQHIPENPTGYFSPTHTLSTSSLPQYQGVLYCL